MKTAILIPIDFSVESRNAIDYAISLYKNDGTYILFNSYEEPRANVTSMVSLRDILAEASLDSLKDEMDRVLESHPGLNVSVESMYGDPNLAIIEFAKREKIQLIVMGTKGASALSTFFLGSVAKSVLYNSHCPVIVVPKTYQYSSLGKILLASDLNNNNTLRLQDFLLNLIAKHDSHLTILTVAKDEENIEMDKVENAYAMHNSLQKIKHDFDLVEGENVDSEIHNYATTNDYDMIVTIPRNASWLKLALSPSVTKNLVQNLEVPMLALH